MFLNPSAWNHAYGSRQIIQAYHDLLYYLEKTKPLRGLDPTLSSDILADNIYLVRSDLYNNLFDYVVADKPSWKQIQEEQLGKIKNLPRLMIRYLFLKRGMKEFKNKIKFWVFVKMQYLCSSLLTAFLCKY